MEQSTDTAQPTARDEIAAGPSFLVLKGWGSLMADACGMAQAQGATDLAMKLKQGFRDVSRYMATAPADALERGQLDRTAFPSSTIASATSQ
jgi:hypothetical protein